MPTRYGAIANRAAARRGITTSLDVQNVARVVWSCTVRARRKRTLSAWPNRAFDSPEFGRRVVSEDKEVRFNVCESG